RLLPDLVDAAKSFRHQKAGSDALAFKQCIGADGGAVAEERDVLWAHSVGLQRFDSVENGAGRVVGCRMKFSDRNCAGILIEAYEIRECSSGVHRHPVPSQLRSPPRVGW